MNSAAECVRLISENLAYIRSEFGVTGITLFGSVARGDNRSDSDVDILVDMPPRILQMSALKLFLENLLHASVDLVRRHAHLSQKFLNQIYSDAITIL